MFTDTRTPGQVTLADYDGIDFISPAEYAALIGTTPRQVMEGYHTGLIPGIRVSRRRYRLALAPLRAAAAAVGEDE